MNRDEKKTQRPSIKLFSALLRRLCASAVYAPFAIHSQASRRKASKSILAVIAVALLFIATRAQQRDQGETLKLKTDLVTVTATVLEGGAPLKSLRAQDFIIYEDGARQKITHFASTEEPFTIMLLLDISGSTQNDIELIRRAARGFLKELRKNDSIAVIVFSREIEQVADFEDSRDAVEAAIDSLASAEGDIAQRFTPATGTSFYDALRRAADDLRLRKTDGRKAIVCMSDGVDSTSRLTWGEAAGAVERSEASVYFLALNTEEAMIEGLLKNPYDPGYINFSQSQVSRYFDEFNPSSPDRALPRKDIPPELLREMTAGLYRIAERDMKLMTERAGGRVYAVNALTDLAAVYRQVADNLRSQYTLGYYPENDSRDGRWRSIRVEVARPGAAVRARSGYWAK
ncbi:MAG: VWA domain-containing protein [Acidobacteriota bacterium]